jgi:CubicO group peptidase (beta-lactamase class C family)
MFTAAAVVKLSEQGKLRLDEPIGKYANGLSPKIAALTASQLLSHTGGLKDAATMFGKHDDAALGETVRALKDDFLFAEPGRIYSYSNPGYWLAGYLIEAVSGKAYADQMSESLFKPLGMQRTTFRPTLAMTYPLAQGHEGAPPKVIRPAADNAGNWPAGSMFSNVYDLSRWATAFLNEGLLDDKRVLSLATIAEMVLPRANLPGSANKYGLGLTLATVRGVKVVEHGGSRSGYGSFIRLALEPRVAIILLLNKTGGSLPKTLEKASELMLPLSAPAAKPQPSALTESEMRQYVGVFGEVELLIKDGKLMRKAGGNETPVMKVGEMTGRRELRCVAGAAEFVLILGADGTAEFLHAGGRTTRKQN